MSPKLHTFTETLFPDGIKCKGVCFHFALNRKFWNKHILLTMAHADSVTSLFMVLHRLGRPAALTIAP